MSDLLPEAKRAIEIADKYLAGESPARRAMLAKDIILAIKDFAETMALDAMRAFQKPQQH